MNLEVRHTVGCKAERVLRPAKGHQAIFVIVAEEEKTAVSLVCRYPLIAVRQWDEVFLFRSCPPQPQTRKRTLHSLSDGKRACLVAHERRRIDADNNFVANKHHVSTNP
jgi:hypothetical protein